MEPAAIKSRLFPLPKSPKTGFLTVYTVSPQLYPFTIMSRICHITGKGPTKGSIVYRRGVAKKAGGIGTHVTKRTKRKFRPNLQRIRVKLPSGQIKRVWVTVKALKAGLVQKV
jgi:large subunit ribosomal protein L28